MAEHLTASEKSKQRSKRWYQNNKEYHRNYMKAWESAHVGHSAMRNRDSRLKTKIEVINHMGGKCVCCGEAELEFLTIDHVNGGGEQERKKLHREGQRMYAWLRANNYPDGYQVLCFNCNWSKHVGDGVCAHKRKLCPIV